MKLSNFSLIEKLSPHLDFDISLVTLLNFVLLCSKSMSPFNDKSLLGCYKMTQNTKNWKKNH